MTKKKQASKMANTWGGARPGAGRKPTGNAKDRPVYVRLSEAERAAVDLAASANGETISEFCRRQILRGIKKGKK